MAPDPKILSLWDQALDEALSRLEQVSPEVAAVVRLRFYAGLSVEETAQALGVSARTVKREWTYARARLFMACWNVTASSDDEFIFQLRGCTLTLRAVSDVMERALRCPGGDVNRFVFDLSGVDEIESCYSVICALFIRFATQFGKRCRITGLSPRLAEVLAFFLKRVDCIKLESGRQPNSVAA